MEPANSNIYPVTHSDLDIGKLGVPCAIGPLEERVSATIL